MAIRKGSRRPFGIFPVAQIGRGACTYLGVPWQGWPPADRPARFRPSAGARDMLE
jgi:hypothetical protein